MRIELLFAIVGLLFLVWLWFFTLQLKKSRLRERPAEVKPIIPSNLLDNHSGVIVTEGRGHLVYINPRAQEMFGLNGGEPDFSVLAERVQPSDVFHDLFADEGQAALRVGLRQIRATSHLIPSEHGRQMVVVLREIPQTIEDEDLDPTQALLILQEISQTITNELDLSETLNSILGSIARVLAYDSSEITLWYGDLRTLRPIGRSGDSVYADALDGSGGIYEIDEGFTGWIARYRQPLLLGDVSVRPDVAPKLPDDFRFQSYLGLPLMVGNRFIGTLELASFKRYAFDHEDMALLQSVAGQVAIAIENARLSTGQSSHYVQLNGLRQIAEMIDQQIPLESLYQRLNERLANLLNVEICGFLLYDKDSEKLVSQLPFYGISDSVIQLYQIPAGEGTIGHQLLYNLPSWFTNDVLNDERAGALRLNHIAEAVGLHSVALAPMVIGGERIGLLQISNKRDNSGINEDDMRLLGIFATQASVVIENARLHAREQQYRGELGGLRQLAHLTDQKYDQHELLQQITTQVADLMRVEICGMLFFEEGSNEEETELILVGKPPFYGIDEEGIRYLQIAVVEDSIFAALFEGRPFWLSNNLMGEEWPGALNFARLANMVGINQVLITPLAIEDRRIGVLLVANKLDKSAFDEDDANILSIATGQTAVLVDNMQLTGEMEQSSRATEGIRQLAGFVGQRRSASDIIKDMMGHITQLFDAEMVAVALLDNRTGNLVYQNELIKGFTLESPLTLDVYSTDFDSTPVMSQRLLRSHNLSHDSKFTNEYRAIGEKYNLETAMQVPMIINEKAIGEFVVANKRQGHFNEQDEKLALNAGTQMAAAIEYARLYELVDVDLAARFEAQEAIDRVSQQLGETLLLDRILEIIRGEAIRTTEADEVSVVLFVPQDRWVDVEKPEIQKRIGTHIMFSKSGPGGEAEDKHRLTDIEQQVIKNRQAVNIPDYLESTMAATPDDARSAYAQPVFFGEEIVAIIHLYARETDRFNETSVEFVKRLGQQASLAVSNARRYEDQLRVNERLRRRANQIEQIFGLSQMLREGASLPELMQEVAYAVSETVGFHVVSISTYDKQADGYRPVAQAGKTLAEFEADAQRLRPVDEIRGLMQPRWRVSNSYFLPSEEADEWGLDTLSFVQEPASDTETVRGPRAWQPNDLLLVPMLGSSENPLGYISPDVPYNERRPDMDTLESLEVFAAQAAFIIENFQLVESVQLEAQAARRERDRLARLHLVSDEIQRTTDMHERLQVIADGIVSVGWERVQITLRNARMEPELLIHSGYSEEEARRLESRLLPGEVWRERLNDLEFHELRLGNAYYLRYDAPWVQKNMFRDRKPDPPQVKIYEWHPQDVLYMPLIGQDQRRIIGLIRMEGPADGRRPRADSLQPIELFASQAAAVIENTRLYEETVRQAAIEQRLNELMEAMASTLDQTEIIRALANGLKRLIEVTRLHLAMPNVDQPNTLELTRVEYTADGKVHIFPDSNIEREGSALGEVFDKGEAQSFDLNNVEITLNYQDLANWSEEGEHNTLLVPMITGGEAIGVLRLGSEDERENVFADEQNQNLIQRMANLSAVSVQNSRLFTSLEATTSFNQAVVESIQQGIVVLDNDIRIRIINNFMVTRYKWSREAQGRLLFSYRPEFRDFLEESISKALETGEEQHKFDIQDIDADGNLLIRNFYTYPLRQGQRMTGVVLLVEDITERALLGVELASRAEQLAALTNVSNQMTQILQPNQVVEVVLDALGTVIPYDGVGLWLVSSNNPQRLEIRAARGFHDQGTTPEELIGIWVEIESSDLFREMALEKKVINVGDTATDTKRFPYGSQRAYRNWLGAPLISKGDVIGVLQLEKTQPNFYDEHHEQLVIAFANQAAVALNNAQLFAETQERAEQLNKQAERLELLNRVSASLAHSLDQENIFEITLKETAHALGIEEAAAIKIDPENNLGRIIIEYPRGHEEPTTIFQLTSAPIIQQIRDLLKPVVVDDFPASQHYEQLKPIVRRDNVSAMVFVPLVLSGSVVGIMRFDATQPGHRFTPEQIELAQTISSQAAIAVQNASLYEQSVRRTYELQTLFDASQSIAVTLDSEDVMRRVSTLMLIALQADTSAIMMWDNVSSTLEVVETSTSWDDIAVAERGTVYDLDKYPVRKQVIQDQSVIVLRTDQENIDPAERESMEKSGVHNRLFAPLIVNEVSIGLVQVEMRDIVRAFEGDQVRLTRTLTSQAAIAIENARLQSETRTQIEELYLINDLSKAVSSTVELGGLLDQVRDQLPMLTEAEYVYVALYEDDKNTISFPLAVDQNLDTFEIEGGRLNEADEFGWIVKRQRPLLLAGENLDQVRASFGINEPSFPNARCFLGVPMIVGDSVIGVLALRDDHEPLRFSHSEQRILTTVGSQLAVAIQNARLFEQTAAFATELEERVLERTREVELERQRLSTLYEIASEIAAATLDLERVLKRTLELVSEAIGASSGVVLKIDDISDQLFVYEQLGLDVENEEERLQLRLNEGLAGWIIQNRQGVVIEDLQKDYRWIAISEREKKPRSAVAALMEGGDEIAGVIMFYNEEVGVFNEDHLRLVSAAASQLANAMSSAELYELIRDQAERLGAILRQEQIESTKNTAILNSIADGVMYANQTGIIRVFNNTASRILGLMDDQVLNRHISEVSGIFGGRSSGWTDVIDEWMEDPTLIQPGHFKEEILNLQDGRVISVRLSPVNMGDQFLGTVSVFRDITREAELDRLKSEFVANVSHELRTPMTSIKGYADLLLLGAAGEISEAQQRFLQTIKQNADRLSILVNDLLEISKLDQTEDLEFAPVDVNDIIEFAASHLSGRVRDEDKQIEIKTSVNGDLPPIRADHDKIMQIMQNLSDNAFNYTMSGGSITLGAQYVPDDQAVIMTVQDTGIGIPEEAQPRVFERFFRGDEYSQVVFDTPGTGLGLAIVKELVTIHKGEISFKSVPEKGTTFYVKIPTVTSRIENSRDSSDTTDSDIR